MELRHLRYFIAVAEEQSFTRAAKRLHIAQPPLSQQIRQFEEELEVKLFERSRLGVKLTDAGIAALAEARATLVQAGRLPVAARRSAEGVTGRLTVGFSSAAPHGVLPNVVESFRRRFPEVSLQLRELSTEQQIAALLAGEIDVGFVRLPLQDLPPQLAVKSILREPLILAVPRSHALSRKKAVPLRALKPVPMIRIPRNAAPGLYDQIEQMCSRAGFRPQVVQEVLQVQTAISLVAAGLGAAIVPESTRSFHPEQVMYRRLIPRETTEMGIAYERANRSATLRQFLGVVEKV